MAETVETKPVQGDDSLRSQKEPNEEEAERVTSEPTQQLDEGRVDEGDSPNDAKEEEDSIPTTEEENTRLITLEDANETENFGSNGHDPNSKFTNKGSSVDKSTVDKFLLWFVETLKKSGETTLHYVEDWKLRRQEGRSQHDGNQEQKTLTNDPYPGDLWTVVTCFCFAIMGLSALMLELGPAYFQKNLDLEEGEFDWQMLQVFMVMFIFFLAFYGSEKMVETHKRRSLSRNGLLLLVIYDAFVLNCFPIVETMTSLFHWTLFSWSTAVVLCLMLRLAKVYRKLKALRRQDVLQGDPQNDNEMMQSLGRRRTSGLESLLYQLTCTFLLASVACSLYLASTEVNPLTGCFINVLLACDAAFLAASSWRFYLACRQDSHCWAQRQQRLQEDEVWNDRV